MSRYNRNKVAFNDLIEYKELLDKRGVKRIEQYRTSALKNLNIEGIESVIHTFGSGDSFWKLANQYYGDPKYWYIIARFNNAPTEASISIGDQIRIPISLSLALQVVV
jgi:nucleoid-associated protein YgaU